MKIKNIIIGILILAATSCYNALDQANTEANLSPASLKNLEISAGNISPEFRSNTFTYNVSVPNEEDSVEVTPTSLMTEGILEYSTDNGANWNDTTSGSAITVSELVVGVSQLLIIRVTITVSSHVIENRYTISITRRGSSDATLNSLTASVGTFNPLFSSGITSYTLSIPNANSSVNVTPVINSSTATLRYRIDSGAWTDTTSGAAIPVSPLFVNVTKLLEIEVKAQDEVSVKTYSVSIVREYLPGVNWVGVTVPGAAPASNWTGITSSSDGTKLAAVVNGGYIYTSTDSGGNWTQRDSVRNWQCITSSSDGTKLAAGVYGGYIYTSTDSGATWTARTSSGSRNWVGITSSSDGAKFAAVDNGGYIYTSGDSGSTWTARTSAGSRNWTGITSSSDGIMLCAVVYGGYIYTSTDPGGSWTPRDSKRNWQCITSSSDGNKLVAGVYGGNLYRSTNSGANWDETCDTEGNWQSIISSSDGTKLAAVSYNGYIYISDDSGGNWVQRDSVRNWQCITMSSDGTKLAAVVNGSDKIYISHP